MVSLPSISPARSKLASAAAVLAGLTFNNWLLGPFLNARLFGADGSISEFSVRGQPDFWVFRGLDIAAGLLLIGLAYLLKDALKGRRYGQLLLIATAALGLANVADALAPLSCSETLDGACKIAVRLSHGYSVPAHAYSSVAVAICYFLLPLSGLLFGRAIKSRFLTLSSGLLVILALYSFVSAVVNYIRISSLTVRTSGAGQEVQMLLLGLWLAAFYSYFALRQLAHKAVKNDGPG